MKDYVIVDVYEILILAYKSTNILCYMKKNNKDPVGIQYSFNIFRAASMMVSLFLSLSLCCILT